MERIEARIVLKSLLQRVERNAEGGGKLLGPLTDTELETLQFALQSLGGSSPLPPPVEAAKEVSKLGTDSPEEKESGETDTAVLKPEVAPRIVLDLSVLAMEPARDDTRICLDFGTAMSKATLVRDESDEPEEIVVLALGEAADQDNSFNLLVSAVYIDNGGLLWFGKAAIDRHGFEAPDGDRMWIDNIKRRISEGGMDAMVGPKYNPTAISVSYGDMVLAYLTFLTWTAMHCLAQQNYPRNTTRRFAMPCFGVQEARKKADLLRCMLGEAQVLADTFDGQFADGIPLEDFLAATVALRAESREYPYVAEEVTEPLGVAGSLVSWKSLVNQLVMVIDVGAGTTDFSLYRLKVEPGTSNNVALEIFGSARGIQEAGNHLDMLLREFVLSKAQFGPDNPLLARARDTLQMDIRNYKETLFNEGLVFIYELDGALEVEISLKEFLDLPAVKRFSDSLRTTVIETLEGIDPSWTGWIRQNAGRYLVVALTGGGAQLPMVQALAEGTMIVQGRELRVQKALTPPAWIIDDYEDLAEDYARIAVSLGGARKRLIQRGSAHVTADAGVLPLELGGFFIKGN